MSDVIVGRDEELGVVRAFFADPVRTPRALVLEGDAGIGKSTLWRAGVEAARELGFRVLVSRPPEGEQGLVHSPLGDRSESVLDDVRPESSAPSRRGSEWR